MIVISRKRIEIILTCIFISLFAFSFHIANDEGENTSKNNMISNAVSVSSVPVSGKTVVLDAGHGKPDEGAQSRERNNRS